MSKPARRGRPPKASTSQHIRVDLQSGSTYDSGVRFREERLQNSTGRASKNPRSVLLDHSWLPSEDMEVGLEDPIDDLFDLEFKEWVNATKVASTRKKKLKRTRVETRPMCDWREKFRDNFLDELLRWNGRGDAWVDGQALCGDCLARTDAPPAIGEFRCVDCFIPALLCPGCCVRRHRTLPFHAIEQWTGTAFVKSSLKALGLRVQLNHMGSPCSNPEPCHQDFLVLHTNGLHAVAVDFCNCTRAIPRYRQLLRRRLYPATAEHPRTCATFELLKQMHTISLTSKCATYDFYRALEKLTDGTGLDIPKSKYRAFLRMGIQWRHLKLLKRGGRGHDDSGAKGTKEGDLAVRCPSCPYPGINLPEGWEKAPPGQRFLYFVILCMDANFRLKNQLVSNYSQDPGLGIGMAYMVNHEPYEEYVKSRADDIDDGDSDGCNLQAVEKAYTKYSKGLRYTGVTAVSCGRSEMIMPCSVGNLQKGERYACMDYSAGSVLQFFIAALYIILSYDIACHWFVNLEKRINEYWPDDIKPSRANKFQPAIPKLHEPGHKRLDNHEQFSLNVIPGVGETDCECPERIWSGNNAVGNSTKTMGPGSRQDVLDDHFGYWNFEKYINMGKSLMNRYRKAVPERNRQAEAHRAFTETFKPVDVAKWKAMCEKWEQAPFPKTGAASPYHVASKNLSQAQVEKELGQKEASQKALGQAPLHTISMSQFLTIGLNIEESQRHLLKVVKDIARGTSDKDSKALAEERASLHKEIEAWRSIQPAYMPGLSQHLRELERVSPGSAADSERPEEACLWLPSSLPPRDRSKICVDDLATSEESLRTAQCHDSLSDIRDVLRIKSRMVQFKNKNIRGQRGGTRSRTIIDRIHNRTKQFAARYRAAHQAKLQLTGPGAWQDTLQELRDSDIRAYQDPERIQGRKRRKGTYEDGQQPEPTQLGEDDGEGINLLPEVRSKRDGTGRSRMTISWIWTAGQPGRLKDTSGDDAARAEWAHSRARVQRTAEEVTLLREEMRRVLAFLDWKACWWASKQAGREGIDKVLAEGLQAYSVRQSFLQRRLSDSFKATWKAPLDEPTTSHDADKSQSSDHLEDESSEDNDDEPSSEDNDEEESSDEGDNGSDGEASGDEGDKCNMSDDETDI